MLTYKEDYDYKMAVGFLLAHDYGFKRVMSSYYFDSNDQGPPVKYANTIAITKSRPATHFYNLRHLMFNIYANFRQ